MKAIIAGPATLALMYRAWSRKSLTPGGIFAAGLTAVAHAVHPWNLPFVLLVVFFLAGTRVTHIKEEAKAKLTLASKGTSGGEGPRTHVQVFANSLTASILTLMHAYQLSQRRAALLAGPPSSYPDASVPRGLCFAWGGDLLVVGIIAQYACVAADTFSSELGILSRAPPRLITSPTLRVVPRGTNGGVTALGLAAGALGSLIVVTAAMLFLPLCGARPDLTTTAAAAPWLPAQKRQLMWFLAGWGALGSVVDSVLGALLQRSVRDVRTGKIVAGEGGARVLVSAVAGVVPPASAEHSTKRAAVQAALLSGEGRDALEHPDETAVADDDDEGDEAASRAKEAKAPPRRAGARRDPYDPSVKDRRASFGDDRPSRVVESGWDLLDNNDVNFLMAFSMSVGAMAVVGWYWGVPLESVVGP